MAYDEVLRGSRWCLAGAFVCLLLFGLVLDATFWLPVKIALAVLVVGGFGFFVNRFYAGTWSPEWYRSWYARREDRRA